MRHISLVPFTLAILAVCNHATSSTTNAPGDADPPHMATSAAALTPVAAPVESTSAPAATTATASTASASSGLDTARGREVGLVFEAFMSPSQEPDEEANTPRTTPAQFRSTTPSQTRAQREAAGHRGHGRLRFTKDFSRVFIDVRIEGVDVSKINMFHIHCGKPGILGPILVDLALTTDLEADIADGVLSVEVRNEHIVNTAHHGHGPVSAFTMGCVIPSPSLGATKPVKVSTVAGMAQIAREGELYFNLHTTGQTYFGDIRGQILAADPQR